MIRHNLLLNDDFAFICTKYALLSVITLKDFYNYLFDLHFLYRIQLVLHDFFHILLKNFISK